MGAWKHYRFKEFTLRPAGAIETDRLLVKQWIEADPFHRGQDADFWLEQGPSCDSYLLLDEDGALFFWKGVAKRESQLAETRIEMHIQFPPMPAESSERILLRRRLKAGMLCGLTWLLQMLRKIDVAEVYFESSSESLAAFAMIHLGFTLAPDGRQMFKRLVLPISPQEPFTNENRREP